MLRAHLTRACLNACTRACARACRMRTCGARGRMSAKRVALARQIRERMQCAGTDSHRSPTLPALARFCTGMAAKRWVSSNDTSACPLTTTITPSVSPVHGPLDGDISSRHATMGTTSQACTRQAGQ